MAFSNDQIRERLAKCKLTEKHFNAELSYWDKLIKTANKKKKKIAKQISKNMLYRNNLINKLKATN